MPFNRLPKAIVYGRLGDEAEGSPGARGVEQDTIAGSRG
jgi:hypothetical protein